MTTERDSYAMRELEAWLDVQVHHDSCRDECRTAMLSVYDSDPEYWSCSEWSNLFDRAKCYRITERYV